jgi:hypothetical protein
MSCPRQLVACLSSWRLGFMPRSVHVVFVMDKVALGQVFLFEFFGFPLSVSFHHDFILVYNFGVNNKPLDAAVQRQFHFINMNNKATFIDCYPSRDAAGLGPSIHRHGSHFGIKQE